ncbi:MAG: hypothetical protein Q8P67_26700 [archaeon]|nr:hypothetical protein [archaeon]
MAIAQKNQWLYAIEGSSMYKVSPEDGTYSSFAASWGDVKGLTSCRQ